MSVRSMTGFACVRRANQLAEITVTLKSVNHRGLDLHFYLSPAVAALEPEFRNLVKRFLLRCHLDARVVYRPVSGTAALSLNTALLESYLAAFRNAADRYGLRQEPDLNAALRLPGMFSAPEEEQELPEEARLMILEAFEAALGELNAFRAREGEEIAALLKERTETVLKIASEMAAIRRQALPAFQARLGERLQELLNGAAIEPQRLAQEVAILVDRSDVGEEIERLEIHAAQLGELLAQGNEIGKKLDFLLQEMNREANTILSKTGGAGQQGLRITELGLEVKAQLEKIREQALNLE